jgi:hypothetical protein
MVVVHGSSEHMRAKEYPIDPVGRSCLDAPTTLLLITAG